MKRLVCLVIFSGIFLLAHGQTRPISHVETMRYINKKLGGKCSLEVTRGIMNASYFEDGELYRADKVKFEALDIKKKSFEKDTKVFFIPCLEEECVERKIIKGNTKKYYSRISFSLDHMDEKGVDGLMKAFQHIYNLDFAPPGYERTQPFE